MNEIEYVGQWAVIFDGNVYSTHGDENEAWEFIVRHELDMQGQCGVERVVSE